MINVDYFRPAPGDDTDRIHTVFPSSKLAAKLGQELQGLYGDVGDASQPCHLLALAERIDDQRRAQTGEG